MKNLEETFMRLLIVAEHLGSGELYGNYEGVEFVRSSFRRVNYVHRRIWVHIVCPYVELELPFLFSE